jgi:hypothetical protein
MEVDEAGGQDVLGQADGFGGGVAEACLGGGQHGDDAAVADGDAWCSRVVSAGSTGMIQRASMRRSTGVGVMVVRSGA